MVADDLPKQELLCKLLKMTTSSNDGEALTAMRKANALLISAGWDWDRLIAGKIVVVGDPFVSLKTPEVKKSGDGYNSSRPPPRPKPPPQGQAAFFTPMPRGAAQRPSAPSVQYSKKSNLYPGGCYCCGITVDIGDGFVFNPIDWNAGAKDKWVPICKSCNKGKGVPSSPAKRVFPPIHASINPDLHNL